MLALLIPIDYGVLGLFLAALLGSGAYFSSRQTSTGEFFLAGRSLGWLPLGMSLTAIFVSLIGFTTLPAAAYDHGWKPWIVVLALWLVLPVVAFVAIPIYRGLGVTSLYEYLEYRFSPVVRLYASLLFIGWRAVWLVGAICISSELIRAATGWGVPAWLVAILIGGLGTLIAFLGGLRSGAWSGVLFAVLMFGGAVAVIVAIWSNVNGGASRVAEITRGLGRLEPVELQFAWTDFWTLWGALPFWVLTVLTSFVADQAAVQRLLAAKTENLARTSYLACALALSLLVPALVYVGTGLLANYYDHPQQMRPEWVVNVDGKTRLPVLGEDGRPLIDSRNPAHAVTFESIDRLVEERRILQPNSKEPFTSTQELIDPETNEVRVEKLAMRRPNNERLRGEVIVRHDAPTEMLPHFARQRLSWGAAGLLIAALISAAQAALDAGLNSLTTVIVRDLVIRFGWGRAALAARLSKEPSQLTGADELQLARPLTLLLGIAATLVATALIAVSTAATQFAGVLTLVVNLALALGAPLLAVVLLGMFTRRATTAGAVVGLAAGTVFTLGSALYRELDVLGIVRAEFHFASTWTAIGGFAVAIIVGYVVSFLDAPRTNNELRGLVVGCGELGRRSIDVAVPLITVPEEEIRWK